MSPPCVHANHTHHTRQIRRTMNQLLSKDSSVRSGRCGVKIRYPKRVVNPRPRLSNQVVVSTWGTYDWLVTQQWLRRLDRPRHLVPLKPRCPERARPGSGSRWRMPPVTYPNRCDGSLPPRCAIIHSAKLLGSHPLSTPHSASTNRTPINATSSAVPNAPACPLPTPPTSSMCAFSSWTTPRTTLRATAPPRSRQPRISNDGSRALRNLARSSEPQAVSHAAASGSSCDPLDHCANQDAQPTSE